MDLGAPIVTIRDPRAASRILGQIVLPLTSPAVSQSENRISLQNVATSILRNCEIRGSDCYDLHFTVVVFESFENHKPKASGSKMEIGCTK